MGRGSKKRGLDFSLNTRSRRSTSEEKSSESVNWCHLDGGASIPPSSISGQTSQDADAVLTPPLLHNPGALCYLMWYNHEIFVVCVFFLTVKKNS